MTTTFLRRIGFLLIILLFSSPVWAQRYSIQGVLRDSSESLAGATVMLLKSADSTLAAYTRTDANGRFLIRYVQGGEYTLKCTYFGYHNLQKRIDASGEQSLIDVGDLPMLSKNNVLHTTDIVAQTSAVTLRGDTIEYNAAAYYVKPNATAEDLLKQMPGIEVDIDGTITAQGEEVKTVTVDGKKFFGDDPKLATQNLPANAVDKVQVYDKKSEQATFSGVDDGKKEKAINLELKEDKKKGWFGKAAAGGGSDFHEDPDAANMGRFEGNTTLNRFSPKRQLSILGLANNVNRPGFSFNEYMDFTGASRQMAAGGGAQSITIFRTSEDDDPVPLDFGSNNGFLQTFAGGVNLNQEYGKSALKSNINANYFYNEPTKNYIRDYARQTLLPDNSFATVENTTQESHAKNHRIAMTVDQKIDSFNSVQLTSTFVRSATDGVLNKQSLTFDNDQNRINDINRNAATEGIRNNLNGALLWRHRFARKGRSLSTNFEAVSNQNESESQSRATTNFYDDQENLDSILVVNQNQFNQTNVFRWGNQTNYTEPLGNKRFLELTYQFQNALNTSDREVYDVSGEITTLNPALSNAYDNRFTFHRAGAGFRINRKTWNGSLGFNAQTATIEGEIRSGAGVAVIEDYQHLLPRLDFNYEFAPSKRLRFNYNTDITAPTVQQLQPVADLSDPLSVMEGNPNLAPEYSHQANANFFMFNAEKGTNFSIGGYARFTENAIIYAQSIDNETFAKVLKPVNAAYRRNANLWTGYGIRVKKIESRFRINGNMGVNESIGLVNEVENKTTTVSGGFSLSWYFNPAKWFNMESEAEWRSNRANYSLSTAIDQTFNAQNYSTDLSLTLPKHWQISTDFNLSLNTGRADGYNQTIPLWGASVSKFFLKGQRLEVVLAARDLLDRNISINRTATYNYVEDERVASIGRYFMLRAVYSLQSLEARKNNPGMRMRLRG